MKLPRSLDELAGLRAARWTRESTRGQVDAFGPDAQREQQDRAIERWGLVDTGRSWLVAHSGRTIGSTDQFAVMMAAAGVEYDVLVVGYVSRFARDLRTAVNARHELHDRGAAILFADERLLTSEEDRWDEWAREAVEAESYSRKLGRRIREGYAAKRRHGEPGGRPPFGWERDGRPPRLRTVDAHLATVRAAYALAAVGQPDRLVAATVGLPLDTVRGILTNPIYVGQLRDGSPASIAPVVDVATWHAIQQLRAARRTRGGKPETVRTYALPMLRCAACGVRLIGDAGRYRHRAPCAGFTAARRRQRYRNRLVRTAGSSYPAELYEGAIGAALAAWSVQPADLVRMAAEYSQTIPTSDRIGLHRLEADRQRALDRYRSTRDAAALKTRMAELDLEERAMQEHAECSSSPVDWPAALALLRDLAKLWTDALPGERRQLAEQLFAHVDALGCRELVLMPTQAAVRHGLVAGAQSVTVVGATGFDPITVRVRAPSPLRTVAVGA